MHGWMDVKHWNIQDTQQNYAMIETLEILTSFIVYSIVPVFNIIKCQLGMFEVRV